MIEIRINKALYEITVKEIEELFAIIKAFKTLELKNNELDEAWIQITSINQWEETKYINIFKMVRNCRFLGDFEEYFRLFNKHFEQSHETKIHLDSYLNNYQEIKQKIIIKTLFPIRTTTKMIIDARNGIMDEIKRKTV